MEEQAVSSFSEDLYTETTLPVLTPISQSIDANVGGYIQGLPASYAQHPGKRYPLILFLSGYGGLGDGSIRIVSGGVSPHTFELACYPRDGAVLPADWNQ